MKSRFLALALLAPVVGISTASNDALACGGCVAPPETNTIVNSHRMALSISPKQTVLWDQIRYQGDPQSWGWLLPVKPGAVVEVSTDAWFETLDAATTTNVSAPPINCPDSSSFGCAEPSLKGAPLTDDLGGNGVSVIHRGTVGPYSTITVSTNTPGILNDWLAQRGFNVPADSAPIIDAYIKEGFDFIALELQPDKSVDEMKPVRVVQPGAVPTLPLRMVAVGAGAQVAITLYIISEGRWEAQNFPNVLVPTDLLAWDFQSSSSNYSKIRASVLEQQGGSVWLTNFAQPRALMAASARSFDVSTTTNQFSTTQVVGEAYVAQGVKNNETNDAACAPAFNQFANSSRMVIDPCPPGVPSYHPSCGTVGANETDARIFECGATDDLPDSTLDDMATALHGLHPKDVWVTRLEANLSRAALAKDLVVVAAPQAKQIEVSADLRARFGINQEAVCGSAVMPTNGRTPADSDKERMLVLATMLGAGILAWARKRLRSEPIPKIV